MREDSILIDEFQVAATVDTIVSVIQSYRTKKHKIQRSISLNRWLAPSDSGFEVWLIDLLPYNGDIEIFLGGGDLTRVKILITPKDLPPTEGHPEAREHAKEIIKEIALKSLRLDQNITTYDLFRLRTVKNWRIVQRNGMPQKDYCEAMGIDPRTLRNWIKEFDQAGKI